MILATALDKAFVELTAVMLRSVSEKNANNISQIYILSHDLDETDRKNLQTCIEKSLCFVDMNPIIRERLPVMPENCRLTISAYSRIFLPELVADTTERILYVDGDTIVVGALGDLEAFDMQGHGIAAAVTEQRAVQAWLAELGLPPNTPYMNSGVLLIDPGQWARDGLTEKLLQFVLTFNGPSRFADQDAFNAVLAGAWARLPTCWNMRRGDFRRLSMTANDARIIHFAGSLKPNVRGCDHPGTAAFLRYRRQTPFATQPLLPGPAGRKLNRLWRKIGRLAVRAVDEVAFWLGQAYKQCWKA